MKKIIFALLTILLVASVSALTVKEDTIRNTIVSEFNQPAEFDLIITGAESGSYNVYTLTDVKINPSTFQLKESTNKITIYVYPTENFDTKGFYTFTYTIKSNKETYQDKLTIKSIGLKDAIEISSDTIDPEDNEIKFYIENKENIKLENINVKFSSDLFKQQETISLKPYEKKYITANLTTEQINKIKAGNYILDATFETDKQPVETKGKIYIGEKKGILTQKDSAGLLINTNTITKTNTGNVPQTISINLNKDIISRLFTNFNHEPTSITRQGFSIKYTWKEKLDPSQNFSVKAKTNYFFPVLIILLAGIVILGFRRYTQTKIDVKKSVSHVKTKGGEFALKVNLNIKAKTRLENVSIIDKIPPIVKVYKKYETTKPDKIDTKNRRLQWNIGDLEVGEERSLNYIVYSKVGVVGRFSLPEALCVFEKEGEIHETESNKVFFLSEQTKKE